MAESPWLPATGPARVARGARGAVVAPHHLATSAGLAVLAAGGHAVDAAIATNAVLGVVMPNGCGIGGDAFWLVWDEAAGEQVALNGSGRAPAAASAQGLRDLGLDRIPLRGPLGISVPGAVRSWSDAHARWGRLSRDAVLAAAIEHADAGFPAWDGLAVGIERTAASLGNEPWSAGFRSVWQPGGRGYRAGDLVRLPALAATLRTLADEGFDAYYDGALGERIARGLAAAGAPFTADDLRGHRTEWTTPISTTYRGVRVTTHPPNSSGLVALEILNVLGRAPVPDGARFDGRGWSDAGVAPPAARGRQARVRRPRRVPRRPGVPRRPRRAPPGRRPRRQPRGPHRPRARRPRPAARPHPRRRHDLPRGRRRRGQRGQPHPVERLGLRLGRPRPRHRRPLPEPRRLVLARPRQPQRPRARQAAGAHADAGHAVPRGRAAAVGRRRVDGRRHPAPDPRPARVGAGRRRRRHRDGRRGAAGRRRACRPAPSPGGRGDRRRARRRASRTA